MDRKPLIESDTYKAAGKLEGKVTLITGGDSGIGAATAILFAKEGAKVAFTYHSSDEDATRTENRLKEIGAEVLVFKGDVGDESFAEEVISSLTYKWGTIDVLVNHAGEQRYQASITDIKAEQIDRTYRTNIFSMFYFVKAALNHLSEGASIINTSSITAYKGNPTLMDYSGANGARVSFTRSLAQNQEILDKKIRVNSVAPGPIWTPLIPSTFPEDDYCIGNVPGGKKRPQYPQKRLWKSLERTVHLVDPEKRMNLLLPMFTSLPMIPSYVTGQTIHVNGGVIVNG